MPKKLPKISIVTPSFNQGQFIKETIESVLSQNYPNLEYWVIDGGSTDETVAILKSYGKKIKWLSEKDAGQTDALNKGFARCTGEIFAYLNSDDCFLPGALQTVGKYFATHPGAEWLTGDYTIIDAQGNEIQQYVRRYKQVLRAFPTAFVQGIANGIAQPSTFWRSSLAQKIGPFDATLRYCMDYDYWQRAFQETELVVLPEKLSQFRIHAQSKGGAQFAEQFAEESLVLSRYNHDTIAEILHDVHAFLVVTAYKILK